MVGQVTAVLDNVWSVAVLTCECSEPCIMAMHVVVKMI
jgi:hypothetical protein